MCRIEDKIATVYYLTMRLTQGSKVGPYTINGMVGSGPMSLVYRAEDAQNQRTIALKLLARALTFNAFARAQFLGDVDAVNAVPHPKIVDIYHFGQHHQQIYMAMPFMPGKSLVERIEQGVVTATQAAEILRPIADGLDAAHALGRLHSNLKPSNILFDGADGAMLSDFSLGELMAANSGFVSGNGTGNVNYFSPEQIRGDRLDVRSDVYALAVLLFEMISGRKPYRAHSAELVSKLHLAAPIPTLNNAWDALFAVGLAKRPEERPSSASALVDLIPTEQAIAISQQKPRRSGWLNFFNRKTK